MTSILERPAPPPDLTVPYGALPEQIIDLHLPEPAPAPLVVLVHGGFWRPVYDRAHLGPMAHALAALGHVVAVPEYRRAGMAADWTGTFDDIAAALDQVTAIAAAHGADPARITWAGHSAGGHLVLWAAARPYFPEGSPWRGACDATRVVSLAGCASLRLCAEWNLGDGAVRRLLGGGPAEVPDRYAVTDPAALTPPSVPVIHVHGTDDDVVPIGMSQAFPVGRVVELPHTGHFDLIDPESPAWPTVITALDRTTCQEKGLMLEKAPDVDVPGQRVLAECRARPGCDRAARARGTGHIAASRASRRGVLITVGIYPPGSGG